MEAIRQQSHGSIDQSGRYFDDHHDGRDDDDQECASLSRKLLILIEYMVM
jgi:hypothetical protein